MKVCICTKWKDYDASRTGKGFFAARLAKELTTQGVDIVTPDVYADINLAIGKFNYEPNARKTVLRLGAAHIDSNSDYKKLNKRKAKALKKADGIVYQSVYSKMVCHAFIGTPTGQERVIFNGAEPNEFLIYPYKSPFKYNFLASAREWTPQKRLDTIITAYFEADIANSCLRICGNTKHKDNNLYSKKHTSCSVRYLGLVDRYTLASLYNLCDAMIDITWQSACPNSVAEALVAGCPVISSNDGGIHELGWSDKEHSAEAYHCMRCDEIWDMKRPINLRKPPEINLPGLVENIKSFAKNETYKFTYKTLHMQTIAKQYLEFFNELLK